LMTDEAAATPQSRYNGAPDIFAEARRKLFPPLHNRTLTEAANALADNRVDIAESLVATFLERRPRDPDALNLMADIARRSKRFEEAEQLLVRCIAQSPRCAGYRFNYSIILRRLERYDEALAQLDELLGDDPRNPLYRDQKASVLRLMGKDAEAIVYRRELSEDYPASPEAWLHYGHALRNEGDQDQCIAAYHRALELAPSLSAAYGSLADLKIYRFAAAEIESMEAQLGLPGLSTNARADLHHALGKAYGDEKLYAKSFENYAKGNALRRLGVDFDQDRLTAHRLANESFFTQTFFCDRSGCGFNSRAPVFIVGMPRSGSTLLEQILSSHSAIEGLGELADLDKVLVRPLTDDKAENHQHQFGRGAVAKSDVVRAYLQMLNRLDGDHFRSLGEQYLEVTGRRRTTERPFFTDKTLPNYFYTGLIHLILPNAKIIDARRHPLDCGWSCFKSQFPGGHFALRLGDIGRDYSNYVRLMAHFDRALPRRIHRVIYESLVTDPRTELGRLFEYLELPFEEQCLRFYENKRAVATQSSEQVRMPLYTSGVDQWLPYEPWLGPLKSALGAVLDSYPNAPE
jgi:tetratricopeptide (TPR) repeat protein